jgi:hypothetical protein
MPSISTSLIIVARVFILAGCCIILCVQGLIQQLIETTFTKPPPPYQNNVFLLETQEHEIQWLLNEFEEKKKSYPFYQSICYPIDYLKIPQVAILGDLHV